MTALVEGLAQFLADLGHGVYRTGTPYQPGEIAIVLGDTTPKPDQLLAIRAYQSGPEPDSKLPFAEPYVQLRVRGTSDEASSRVRAQALYDDLHGLGATSLPGGVIVMSIVAVQTGPIPLGRDEAGRHEHTVNVRIDHHAPTVLRPAL